MVLRPSEAVRRVQGRNTLDASAVSATAAAAWQQAADEIERLSTLL
ncbi:hypothetical protein [Microbacterium sp. NPDC076895]